MVRHLFAIACLVANFSSLLLAAETLIGFDELPLLIRENNKQVQAAGLFLEAAKRQTGHLKRSFLPEISAEAGHETFRTGVEDQQDEPFGNIGAELNVFRSGKDKLEEKGKGTTVRLAESEFEEVYRTQLREARETFWVLAFQREMASVLTEALDLNASFLKAANRKISSGLSTGTDRLEFEIYRAELEQSLARLQTEEKRAEKMLALLIGGSVSNIIQATLPYEHDDALIASSFDAGAHPSAQALRAFSENEHLASQQANRWWAPSIDLYSNYSLYTFREREYDDRSDRDESVAGGKVSFALFDRFHSRALYQASSLRADGYVKRREQAERELKLEVEVAKGTLQRLHDLVRSAEEGVSLGNRYLKSTLDEYTRGVKNSPDLVGAVEKFVSVRRLHAEIRLDYQLVKAKLMAVLGW